MSLYSKSYGGRGCKVRVYEPRPGANLMLARFVNGKYHAKALDTTERAEAEKAAYSLINAIKQGQLEVQRQSQESDRLTVDRRIALYLESDQFKDLKERQQKEKKALLEKIEAYFGPSKLVTALDDDAVTGLLRARRNGTHGFGKAGKQCEYSAFAHLRSVILWGLEKKSGSGRLLRENPLLGTAKRLKIRPNKTPAQPLIPHETYLKLLKASKKLPQYVGTFLVVAEGTGRRLSAIRSLTWADVSLAEDSILWRADTDKMGLEMERVAPAQVFEALRLWKEACPSDTWVFPAPEDATLAVPKPTVDKWMRQLYEAAKLTKPARVGWHSLRRKWATERKGYALPDVMAGGGWASSEALMRYLKTDDETIRTVIQKPTRRVAEKVRTEVRTARKTGTGRTLEVA